MSVFRSLLYLLLFLPVNVCLAQEVDCSTLEEPFELDPVVECDLPLSLFESGAKCINLAEVHNRLIYPPSLKQARIEVSVVLEIYIDKGGLPVEYQLVQSSHHLFTEEVLKHCPLLKFIPAKYGYKACKEWVKVPFHFYLTENGKPTNPTK